MPLTAFDYSYVDWDVLCDHLTDIPLTGIFTIGVSVADVEICDWVQIGIDLFIPHWKSLVKPHSSSGFKAACAVAIVHRNHFFPFVPKE